MNVSQAIPSPGGVSVFGSSMVRVEPDLASILCGVVALHEKPIEAFAEVRAAAQAVRAFLQRARLSDVASSRITLKQEFRYVQGEQRPMGYLARVGFHVLLRELDRIEEILVGLVEAGASEIGGVDLQTTQLKDLRVEARRRALEAAREKALVYCAAAGVGLGPPIHIEDLNQRSCWVFATGTSSIWRRRMTSAPRARSTPAESPSERRCRSSSPSRRPAAALAEKRPPPRSVAVAGASL